MATEEITKKIGPYTLVARRPSNSQDFAGVIWLDGKKVCQTDGDTLDEVMALLESRRAEMVAVQLESNTTSNPTAEMARKAFVALASTQPSNRLKMLHAHFHAPEQCITARQLAGAAGFAHFGAANLQYGLLAAAYWEHMPTEIPKRKDGSPIWTCALAEAGQIETANEDEWVWKLKPYVADGLRLAGLW